jgi:SpoVK/Ycf46/Vps4 family AAA+-type ATPase
MMRIEQLSCVVIQQLVLVMYHMDLISDKIEHTASKSLKMLPRILQAALQRDNRRLESLSVSVIRELRTSLPEVAKEISAILVSHQAGVDPTRLAQTEPPPLDLDSTAPLLKIEELEGPKEPVLDDTTSQQLSRFIRERHDCEKLLAEGVLPPRSILLMGSPGTGKTMLARWLSAQLRLRLVTLDLATAISSYLGKTGMNLRRVLDYSRATPCLLLLDEFDSIAKKRDDSSDVGELKRIVNVLLKELEDWPARSVLVAATNHPELLDPAISRRFDRVVTINLPAPQERTRILMQTLGRFGEGLRPELVSAVSGVLEKKSGAEIELIAEAAVRRNIVDSEPVERALLAELKTAIGDLRSDSTAQLVQALKEHSNGNFSVRDLASALHLSPSTIQYHIKKKGIKHG